MSKSRHLIGITAIAVAMGLLAGAATADASRYSHAAPSFDRITMLRVAMAYNLSRNAVDLRFPATSEDACIIAGVGALTFVGNDHGPWAAASEALEESVEATLGTRQAPCIWLHSEMANEVVPNVSRAWGATLKPNFKRLRRGLRRANCKAVYKALDRYPSVDLPADRLHHKVVVVMTRPCARR
jgi:hypothetical protein